MDGWMDGWMDGNGTLFHTTLLFYQTLLGIKRTLDYSRVLDSRIQEFQALKSQESALELPRDADTHPDEVNPARKKAVDEEPIVAEAADVDTVAVRVEIPSPVIPGFQESFFGSLVNGEDRFGDDCFVRSFVVIAELFYLGFLVVPVGSSPPAVEVDEVVAGFRLLGGPIVFLLLHPPVLIVETGLGIGVDSSLLLLFAEGETEDVDQTPVGAGNPVLLGALAESGFAVPDWDVLGNVLLATSLGGLVGGEHLAFAQDVESADDGNPALNEPVRVL